MKNLDTSMKLNFSSSARGGKVCTTGRCFYGESLKHVRPFVLLTRQEGGGRGSRATFQIIGLCSLQNKDSG